jgi:hypothetical protein
MESFPGPPEGIRVLASHNQLYAKIRNSCQYALALLQQEDLDPLQLKVLADDLDRSVADLALFSSANMDHQWLDNMMQFVEGLAVLTRQKEAALLDE